MAKEVTKYQSEDGTMFDSMDEALDYEFIVSIRDTLSDEFGGAGPLGSRGWSEVAEFLVKRYLIQHQPDAM